MASRITFSLANLDFTPNSKQQNDRFIPSRSNFDDLERSLESPKRMNTVESLEPENNENKVFSKILKKNLKMERIIPKTFTDLSILENTDKFKVPAKLIKEKPRKLNKTPFKVLDAPFLQDDYYLNIVDWSNDNVLSVGLGNAVYVWNFHTYNVNKVTQLGNDNMVSSVSWDKTEGLLAVGTLNGTVQYWDPECKKKIIEVSDHYERVGAISLHNKQLLTGSRDRSILMYDLRSKPSPITAYHSHKQEVCGLKWDPNGEYFASGGNDNKLFVYSPKTIFPLMKKKHKAAVKALGWSERQMGLLATGAGSADRCLRLWNLKEQKLIDFKDTGSQICNLVFSKHNNEIITTHGFSNNEINIWQVDGIRKISTLSGHTSRVLYLSMSPCGEYIVTGAGDETLRFWDLNYGEKKEFKEFINTSNILSPNVLR